MVLLSFDIEEFDLPQEHGVTLSFEEQIQISSQGTILILDCLQKHKITATFFCTVRFAEAAPELMARIRNEGHEIASHGYNHSIFALEDLKKSKDALEHFSGKPVLGYRQARMQAVSEQAIYEAGYRYNSSLNPTFIPGRYMNLSLPRTAFYKNNVLQLPASVTPCFRFPLFWLSYHHLPGTCYRQLCARTLRHDGYLITYFHPWEFYPLGQHPEFNIPFLIRRNCGSNMLQRLNNFITFFKKRNIAFALYSDFTSAFPRPDQHNKQ